MAYDPFIQPNPIVQALEAHRGRVEQVRENTARTAEAYATYQSTGDGTFQPGTATLFGATFVHRPYVAYGYSLPDDTPPAAVLPRATGGVRDWVRDERGYYVGAWVFMGVDTRVVPASEVVPTDVAVTPGEEPPTTTPVPVQLKTFTELFDRPNSPLLGRGWQQVGGDFFISDQRCITREATAYLGQPFGLVPLSIVADLRSPDVMSPCVWAWGTQTAGAPAGYEFAFSASAVGTNMTLRSKGRQVAAKHYGTASTKIGNVALQLKMVVTKDATEVTVKCYVKDALQFTFKEPIAEAPTGQWSGVGNTGVVAGNVSIDGIVINELAGGAADPDAPKTPADVEPTEVAPTYVVLHDFTFTGVALKDVPPALLEPGVIASTIGEGTDG